MAGILDVSQFVIEHEPGAFLADISDLGPIAGVSWPASVLLNGVVLTRVALDRDRNGDLVAAKFAGPGVSFTLFND